MAKDTRIPIRLPSALKAEFEWAAERDGCTKGVSTWLRQLGEERAEQLRAQVAPLTQIERENLAFNSSAVAEPAPLEFVPGLGLEEE